LGGAIIEKAWSTAEKRNKVLSAHPKPLRNESQSTGIGHDDEGGEDTKAGAWKKNGVDLTERNEGRKMGEPCHLANKNSARNEKEPSKKREGSDRARSISPGKKKREKGNAASFHSPMSERNKYAIQGRARKKEGAPLARTKEEHPLQVVREIAKRLPSRERKRG